MLSGTSNRHSKCHRRIGKVLHHITNVLRDSDSKASGTSKFSDLISSASQLAFKRLSSWSQGGCHKSKRDNFQQEQRAFSLYRSQQIHRSSHLQLDPVSVQILNHRQEKLDHYDRLKEAHGDVGRRQITSTKSAKWKTEVG